MVRNKVIISELPHFCGLIFNKLYKIAIISIILM